jgi:Na+/phosphate symporter
VQVIFASLTGDIMLDALIGAVFAIISYSSLAAVLLTATLTGGDHLLSGGALPGDWRQPRFRPAGDA